ncbi:MAG: hypothetical protein K1564_18870 [Candidatus Thiodiazotropha sp. (ex. Lucinisca nassula)]|nr:hypothetical protein [Candidatus Thiodiazotropha sp. (ex. Lucinisca nassula)]
MNGVERHACQEQAATQADSISQFQQVEKVAQRVEYPYEMIPSGYQKLAESASKKLRTISATCE